MKSSYLPNSRGPRAVAAVVQQHADDTADLHESRRAFVDAAGLHLSDLARFDARLAAHIDGLLIARDYGSSVCDAALESPSRGRVFAAAIQAIGANQPDRLERIFALTEVTTETHSGLLSAFEWSQPEQLQGIVASLLKAREPNRRRIGLTACAMHLVGHDRLLIGFARDPDRAVRACALRTTGELGRRDVASTCAAGIADQDLECQFWAAWSAILLGNRGVAIDTLTRTALLPGAPNRARAFRLTLQVVDTPAAHALLQQLAREPAQSRWLIQGSGIAGASTYVPWLVDHMSNDQTARIAGEAFSLITGTDLALLDLERKPPENFESGPNDDPEDPNVDMDPDDGLPWPDPERIQKWWAANSSRFQAGTRYFMGAPVTREHCIDVLKNGYQRQRILAAHYLCLLNPGTPLFNTSAPAWRQQKLLAQME